MTLAGLVLVCVTARAAGDEHTPVPAIVLSQNKVAGLMRDAERVIRPLLHRSNDRERSDEEIRHQAGAVLEQLGKAIAELKQTTDSEVDKIINASKKK